MIEWPADAFEQFWKLYPRKVSKGDARKALEQQRRSGIAFELIMKGLQTFARLRPFRDIQFCPYPASWLRAEKWDDEYEQPASETSWKLNRAMEETMRRRMQ